jgi:hypothetical protein
VQFQNCGKVNFNKTQTENSNLTVCDGVSCSLDPLTTKSAVTTIEPSGGLTDGDVNGYDLIWFNNPGHPMSNAQTRDTLMHFKGGVVLQGDDLTHLKSEQSLTELTGLQYIDNGASVVCPDGTFPHDNNDGYTE